MAQELETVTEQETYHQANKPPRRWIRKRCRYSSLDKFKDAFDTTFTLYVPKNLNVPGQLAK